MLPHLVFKWHNARPKVTCGSMMLTLLAPTTIQEAEDDTSIYFPFEIIVTALDFMHTFNIERCQVHPMNDSLRLGICSGLCTNGDELFCVVCEKRNNGGGGGYELVLFQLEGDERSIVNPKRITIAGISFPGCVCFGESAEIVYVVGESYPHSTVYKLDIGWGGRATEVVKSASSVPTMCMVNQKEFILMYERSDSLPALFVYDVKRNAEVCRHTSAVFADVVGCTEINTTNTPVSKQVALVTSKAEVLLVSWEDGMVSMKFSCSMGRIIPVITGVTALDHDTLVVSACNAIHFVSCYHKKVVHTIDNKTSGLDDFGSFKVPCAVVRDSVLCVAQFNGTKLFLVE